MFCVDEPRVRPSTPSGSLAMADHFAKLTLRDQ